jgi:hypothetical protein
MEKTMMLGGFCVISIPKVGHIFLGGLKKPCPW